MSVVRSKAEVPFGVAAAEEEVNEAPKWAKKIWLQNHQTILRSHNLFLMIPKLLKNWTRRDLKWDPNFSPFCNEIPLLNGTDLTQILWDPSWKKKEDLTSISEKVNICYTFDEKKIWTNFFWFLANFVHFGENEPKFGRI